MKQHMADLRELDRFRDAHVGLDWGQPVSIAPDPDDSGAVLVLNHRGEPCGVLPRKGNLCREILAGANVGHISWQMLDRTSNGQLSRLRVRIVTVSEGEHFEMPAVAEPKRYPVGIVGEASYQPAIRRCAPGERVQIVHELDNPYDQQALAVLTNDGNTIGYIARDCWLQDALHDEGHGCEATIKAVSSAENGMLGVVLEVTLSGHDIPSRQFQNAEPSPTSTSEAQPVSTEQKGWLARLFGI
jgi:hypothetical protein